MSNDLTSGLRLASASALTLACSARMHSPGANAYLQTRLVANDAK